MKIARGHRLGLDIGGQPWVAPGRVARRSVDKPDQGAKLLRGLSRRHRMTFGNCLDRQVERLPRAFAFSISDRTTSGLALERLARADSVDLALRDHALPHKSSPSSSELTGCIRLWRGRAYSLQFPRSGSGMVGNKHYCRRRSADRVQTFPRAVVENRFDVPQKPSAARPPQPATTSTALARSKRFRLRLPTPRQG